MSFVLNLHFQSEEEQPTKEQCEAICHALGQMLLDSEHFALINSFVLETPEPSNLTAADVQRLN